VIRGHDALIRGHDALIRGHDALIRGHDALIRGHDALIGCHDALIGCHDALIDQAGIRGRCPPGVPRARSGHIHPERPWLCDRRAAT
jgi:hypothetical protein